MNKYLVITKYGQSWNKASVALRFFQHWKYYVISDEPYIVIVTADSMDQLVENLNAADIECTVTQIGKTVEIGSMDLLVTGSPN